MKMSKELFADLRADCETVAKSMGHDLSDCTAPVDAWNVFHKVCKDRSYNDEHPGFAGGAWTRVLPCTREQGEPLYDRFYKDEDLDDSHIATALRTIFPNCNVR